MRALLLFVALPLAACGDTLPSPPDPAEYAKMMPGERCKATAPRAMRCTDALLVAQVRSLAVDGSGDLANQMDRAFEGTRTSDAQAREIHETMCAGSRHTEYADGVVACWNEKSCEAFAACVMKPAR